MSESVRLEFNRTSGIWLSSPGVYVDYKLSKLDGMSDIEMLYHYYENHELKVSSALIKKAIVERIKPYYLPRIMVVEKDNDILIEVAKRIEEKYLVQMIKHKDLYVRVEVAKRIERCHLKKMMKDRYMGVRMEVAKRIEEKYLKVMLMDKKFADYYVHEVHDS